MIKQRLIFCFIFILLSGLSAKDHTHLEITNQTTGKTVLVKIDKRSTDLTISRDLLDILNISLERKTHLVVNGYEPGPNKIPFLNPDKTGYNNNNNRYAILMGIYDDSGQANLNARKITKEYGFFSYAQQTNISEKTQYYVVSGNFKELKNARQALEKLSRVNSAAYIVRI